MNILFYSPVRLQNGGGCERWHCDITNSLVKQFGHSVEIVTSDLGDDKWKKDYLDLQLQGIPYILLKNWNFFGIILPKPASLIVLFKKFLWAESIHFIHGFAGQDIIIYLLKVLTGKKVIVGHHAPILHKIGFHNWYMKNVSRIFLNKFDAHMTLNVRDKKFLEDFWKVKNVYFIPSGIRLESFLAVKRKIHSKLNFSTVGIYRTQKGIDLLVGGVELFNKLHPDNNAVFRLAGGGELKELVKDAAARNKNIIDMGYLKYEEMATFYSNSDVYLLTSREEPFGLVLIEAWAAGMPVLATKTEGPMDMLKQGKNGWFIETMTPESVCKGIEKVYSMWKLKPKSLLVNHIDCRNTGKKFSIDVTAQSMSSNFFR